ncbi:MAG: response regulator [Ktedonobacteraceae bacterium]|nr:response regulator [Ktedonobacteraceae bacterium]
MTCKKRKTIPIGQNIIDKTILVIEDDDSIGTLLVEALSQETPYQALLVTDAFQALKAVDHVKPCLFITDYRLPHMDGIELYDRLRSTDDLADTPAIILSAYLPVEEIKKRHLISLSKPFELDELLNTVEKLLA